MRTLTHRATAVAAAIVMHCAVACSDSGTVSHEPSLPYVHVGLDGELEIDEKPVVVIGANDQLPGHALHLVQSGVVLRSGGFAVAHQGSESVLYYDSSGHYVRESGRRGKGPGEFQRLTTLHLLDADTITAWDIALKRITVFDSSGALITTVSMVEQASDRHRPLYAYGLGPDGFVLISSPVLSGQPTGSRRERLTATIVDRAGQLRHELGEILGDEYFGPVMPIAGHRFLAAATPGAFYVGDGRAAELDQYSRTGAVTRRLLLPLRRDHLSTAQWEDERDKFLDRRIRPEHRRSVRSFLDKAPRPDSFPAFSDLVGGSDGSLWVQAFGDFDDRRQWLVVDVGKAVARRITLPPRSKLLHASTHKLMLLVRDSADRQHIEVYDFRR